MKKMRVFYVLTMIFIQAIDSKCFEGNDGMANADNNDNGKQQNLEKLFSDCYRSSDGAQCKEAVIRFGAEEIANRKEDVEIIKSQQKTIASLRNTIDFFNDRHLERMDKRKIVTYPNEKADAENQAIMEQADYSLEIGDLENRIQKIITLGLYSQIIDHEHNIPTRPLEHLFGDCFRYNDSAACKQLLACSVYTAMNNAERASKMISFNQNLIDSLRTTVDVYNEVEKRRTERINGRRESQ